MKSLLYFLVLLYLCAACDLIRPQKKFILAIPEDDIGYQYAGQHLSEFLQQDGFEVEIQTVPTAILANELVAKGEADFTFIKNHSLFLPESMKVSPNELRTLMPLYTNLMLLFSREIKSIRDIGTEKRKIKVFDTEAFLDLYEIFRLSEIRNLTITPNDSADLLYFWGTLYEDRSAKLSLDGWFPVSLEADWEEFLLLNNPGLKKFKIPAIPGLGNRETINTVASETLLVCSSQLGENAIHNLSKYIFSNKLRLLEKDRMYRAINEHFDQENLLFPLHEGTNSFLRRDEPTFLESYRELIALTIAVIALAFAIVQAMRINMLSRKKDWADQYYLDFLLVKESASTAEVKHKRLDSLFGRALTHMTKRKLSKKDFHTLSRLIQDEQANLKGGYPQAETKNRT